MASPPVVRKEAVEANHAQSISDELPDITDAPVRNTRPRHQFTIPKKARGTNDPTTVTMVEITSGEEETAYKIAGDSRAKALYEMVKTSIYAVDGRRVIAAEGDAEVVWDRLSPKARKLLISAFNKIHSTTEDEDAAFLASEVVAV